MSDAGPVVLVEHLSRTYETPGGAVRVVRTPRTGAHGSTR